MDAIARGGGNSVDNLVLCHAGCNRQLADRDVAKKQNIREKWRRYRGAQ